VFTFLKPWKASGKRAEQSRMFLVRAQWSTLYSC